MEEKSLSQSQKKNFKGSKEINKRVFGKQQPGIFDNKKRNFARKFVEQQATKAFIKKEDKTNNKAKPKLKSSIEKRDFKMTVSRALNVEEIEIKQRSFGICKKS